MKHLALLAGALALAACATSSARPLVPADVLTKHDYSLADTPNKRTALAYLYTAWNDARVAEARRIYWVPGSVPEPAKGAAPADLPRNVGTPHYTMKQVVEEGDRVVVLAFVKGVGIGTPITTIFGTPGGTKIGDAVVEIFQFAPDGRIARKWDFIQPMSEESYDFR